MWLNFKLQFLWLLLFSSDSAIVQHILLILQIGDKDQWLSSCPFTGRHSRTCFNVYLECVFMPDAFPESGRLRFRTSVKVVIDGWLMLCLVGWMHWHPNPMLYPMLYPLIHWKHITSKVMQWLPNQMFAFFLWCSFRCMTVILCNPIIENLHLFLLIWFYISKCVNMELCFLCTSF